MLQLFCFVVVGSWAVVLLSPLPSLAVVQMFSLRGDADKTHLKTSFSGLRARGRNNIKERTADVVRCWLPPVSLLYSSFVLNRYSRVIGGDLSPTMLAETARRFKQEDLGVPELVRYFFLALVELADRRHVCFFV